MNAENPNDQDVNKIFLKGMRAAIYKLYVEAAAKNETVVISVDGKPKWVPAKDLLDKFDQATIDAARELLPNQQFFNGVAKSS